MVDFGSGGVRQITKTDLFGPTANVDFLTNLNKLIQLVTVKLVLMK